ncbi:hypothetical protein [Aurantimonas sp. HBX-1]|uniref:hypothetical protein n=1 Tax=Aurantimonas sp. HBX-1 TaxID=2906072 RepID=UPI001F26D98F|nr:hypothetical protein [Aurantimonas sp. HBX-1]UIJ73467.1 hypothetical protein LXB15_07495 [Aurantimonas sp. HBX-1]
MVAVRDTILLAGGRRQYRRGDGDDTAAVSPRKEVLSAIRSLAPIFLVPGASTARYLPPRVEFRSRMMSARSSNVESRGAKAAPAVRHTIRCDIQTVLRAWHDLGTRVLDGMIVLSAERLGEMSPDAGGVVWRVFGVGLIRGRATISSCAVVSIAGFCIADRSKGSAVRAALWYVDNIRVSNWGAEMFWPYFPLVSVTNAAVICETGVVRLAGIGRYESFPSPGHNRFRMLPRFCDVVRSDDGTWICLQSRGDPEEALERYVRRDNFSLDGHFDSTGEDLEAIELACLTLDVSPDDVR